MTNVSSPIQIQSLIVRRFGMFGCSVVIGLKRLINQLAFTWALPILGCQLQCSKQCPHEKDS